MSGRVWVIGECGGTRVSGRGGAGYHGKSGRAGAGWDHCGGDDNNSLLNAYVYCSITEVDHIYLTICFIFGHKWL